MVELDCGRSGRRDQILPNPHPLLGFRADHIRVSYIVSVTGKALRSHGLGRFGSVGYALPKRRSARSLRAARQVTRFYLWYHCSCTAYAQRQLFPALEKGNVRASAHNRSAPLAQSYPDLRPRSPYHRTTVIHTGLIHSLLLSREATDGCQRRRKLRATSRGSRSTRPATSTIHHIRREPLTSRGS
jgi:hypothetical protein